jgi:hypothetical protein
MIAAMQFTILTGLVGLQKKLTSIDERFRDCLPEHKASF